MDPLSALGIAGNIVQFVQFAFDLLNNSKRIYNSSSGISEHSESLENIYSTLATFSGQLSSNNFSSANPDSNHVLELHEIARSCKDDCSKLLKLVDKLRVKNNGSKKWWQSFSKALLELWTSKDLEQLKTRITESRSLIILKLCTISCECIATTSTKLSRLKDAMDEAWLSRIERSDCLLRSLEGLRLKAEHIEKAVLDLDTLNVDKDLDKSELRLLIEQVNSLSLSSEEFSKENAVLRSLDFDKRPVRHSSILEAHEKTFRWVFNTSSSKDTPGDRFVNWLIGDQNLFWISGKPGSGKSTLMKFVAGSVETPRFLEHWTGDKKLVLASHYFWSPGSEIQRSREGLLRSLLFDILIQIPEVTNMVCGDMWRDTDPARLQLFKWDGSRLEAAIFKLAQIKNLPARICFFIDGLDEYEGDQLELSGVVRHLSSSRDIKICLSSRPWNIFEDSFGRNRKEKLYVHELTHADISHYSENRLYDHPRWLTEPVDRILLVRLVNQITDRAQGVFLWVFLVTKILREGLANHDSLSDLTKRLESLPVDLEVFFKHMLSSVEPFYHEKMAGTLCIALRAPAPLGLHIYGLHELEYADSDYALKLPVATMNERQIQELQKSTARRLNGWCKGLIEKRDGRVEFIHRTVRDFLRTDEMTAFLKQKAPESFCASLSLLRSYWARIKSGPPISAIGKGKGMYDEELFERAWCDTFIWAGIAQHEDMRVRNECERLLDNMEEASYQLHPAAASLHDHLSIRLLFRENVIMFDLIDYISRKLKQNANYFADCDSAPLSIATKNFKGPPRGSDEGGLLDPSRTLKTLLNHGDDPNEILYDDNGRSRSTPWADFVSIFLSCMCSSKDSPTIYFHIDQLQETRFMQAQSKDVLTAFLDHGSDVNAIIPCDHCAKPQSRIFWIVWLLLGFAVPKLHQQADKYLRDLRRILSSNIRQDQIQVALQRNPTIQQKPELEVSTESGKATSNLVNEPVNAPATHTPWTILCSLVKRISEDETRVAEEKQQGFLGRIILTFIEVAQSHSLQWDDMLPALKKMIPCNLYSQILSALGRPVEISRPNMRRRAKRSFHTVDEDMTSTKRARNSPAPDVL